MSNKNDNFNQTTSELNFTVDSERITIVETSNNSNARIYHEYLDDYNVPCRPEDIEAIPQYPVNIERKISAEIFMMSQNHSQSYPYYNTFYGNDRAVVTPNNSIDAPVYVKTQLFENRRLPAAIYELFPGCREQNVTYVLREVQNEMGNIWKKIDADKKYENLAVTKQLTAEKYTDFKGRFQLYLFNTFLFQARIIEEAMNILEQPSFGAIFLNSKNEILGVKNHHGTWSAPKGHPRINNDGTLETPWETSLRELFEELSIKLKQEDMREITTNEDIDGFLTVDKKIYLQGHLIKRGTNNRLRLIGLFIIHVNEKELTFTVKDRKENMACAWLKMEHILNKKPELKRDKYYTLRPFAKFLNDHPKYLQNK